jgi:hypothetical protein
MKPKKAGRGYAGSTLQRSERMDDGQSLLFQRKFDFPISILGVAFAAVRWG